MNERRKEGENGGEKEREGKCVSCGAGRNSGFVGGQCRVVVEWVRF